MAKWADVPRGIYAYCLSFREDGHWKKGAVESGEALFARSPFVKPAAVVPAPSCNWKAPWKGHLYIAPLDVAIDVKSLKYYNIALVLNTLGKYAS